MYEPSVGNVRPWCELKCSLDGHLVVRRQVQTIMENGLDDNPEMLSNYQVRQRRLRLLRFRGTAVCGNGSFGETDPALSVLGLFAGSARGNRGQVQVSLREA